MSDHGGIILLNQTKGKLMGNLIEALCTTCAGISRTIVSQLCDTHYFEWAEEKAYMDFDRSTEGLYI
jgi:hypothetical protein